MKNRLPFKLQILPTVGALLLLFLGMGCLPNTGAKKALFTQSNSFSDNSGTSSIVDPKFKINNVVIQAGTGTNPYLTTVYFNSSTSSSDPTGLQPHCASNTCRCEYKWNELNTTSGTSVTIPRSVSTVPTTVQPYLLICPAPGVYATEIPDGTTLKIDVVSTSHTIDVDPYSYLKGQVDSADFRDREGRGFSNIQRYTCYETIEKGMEVQSKTTPVTNPQTGEVQTVTLASGFCADGQSSGQGCTHSNQSPSSESNYYNLYVANVDTGGFSSNNQRFTCPLVKEALNTGGGGIGQQNRPWPLDSTFALAKSPSAEYPVGVESPSVLGNAFDPRSAPTECFSTSSGSAVGDANSISSKCIGFAAKPAVDGTCPRIQKESGAFEPTYRLRRYVALYPVSYDSAGYVIQQAHGADVVYVLDRPVPSGDPLKPYTMTGPKPCQWAYFDHSGALGADAGQAYVQDYRSPNGGLPRYLGTNASGWEGKNIDGTHFPDHDDPSENSCAAVLPIVKRNASGAPTFLGLGTVHASNGGQVVVAGQSSSLKRTLAMSKVWIRPREAWAPHYVEDTSFKACAPRSSQFKDPPLHFARRTNGNVAWCAEVYPTQIDAIDELDSPYKKTVGEGPLGYVKPYTSHNVKNSGSSACVATPLESISSSLVGPGLPFDPPSGTCTQSGANNSYAFPSSQAKGVALHPSSIALDSRSGTITVGAAHEGNVDNLCASRTCDRTVLHDGTPSWKRFPLLAEPKEVEKMLQDDDSYSCALTWDNQQGKTGKTPSEGCCASSSVGQGGAGLTISTYSTAHLEPDTTCLPPTY